MGCLRSTDQSGTRECERPQCHTCNYISRHTELQGSKALRMFMKSVLKVTMRRSGQRFGQLVLH